MKLGDLTINKFQLIGVIVLVIGLAVGIFLVQKTQIFKPKASADITKAFEITDDKGNKLNCDGSTNPPTCTTSSLNVNIKVTDLQQLLNQ